MKGENLANRNLNVIVKTISGLKVEQVVDKFSYDLNRCSEAHVLAHAGTNNVELCLVATLLESYEKLSRRRRSVTKWLFFDYSTPRMAHHN